MKKFRFLENGLAGDVFYDPNNVPASVAVYLPGFPSFIGPAPVTPLITKSRLLALQPHCLGSYDSDGLFSPTELKNTARAVQSIVASGRVKNAATNALFGIPQRLEVCIGHSFGCFTALRFADCFTDLRVLVLFAPAVHYGHSPIDFGLLENGPEHFSGVRRAWPKTYRIAAESEWREITEGKDPLPKGAQHPSLEHVIGVVGAKDKYFDIPALRASFKQLVHAYVGEKASVELVVVPNAGHPLDELVNTDAFDFSGAILRGT